MKRFITLIAVILMASLIVSCGGHKNASAPEPPQPAEQQTSAQKPEAEEVELIVAAAASLTDVTKEIAEAYKSTAPNVTLTFTYGASGALQSQIDEGAPADVFISAAKKQMNALSEKGLIHEGSKDLLINRITLIVPVDSDKAIESFADVGTDKVSSIALGDPATTPAGQYGQEIFTGLGILDSANGKANLGSDVRQVLTWVEMGEVDCGIVFMTDALTTDKVGIVAVAEDGTHTPAIYPVGIIEASPNKEAAQEFVDFLYSDKAKELFEKSGFSMAQ